MSSNHDFKVKNGLSVGTSITAIGSLTTAGQTFPAADGSTGQYLKTNGSGALSWGTVSTSLNITDGTTTDTVGLTETVTFTGGTNITLAVTDNTITINNDHVNSSDITENTNLFFTDARAIAAVQGAANLTIDGGTIYVDTSANRVGIVDTSPQQTLDVGGNIGVNGTEVINSSSQIVGAVLDSAMTVGGSLAGVLSNLKIQYGTSYSGTPIQGSFFFDSLNQKLKVYTGSAFVDAVPASGGGGGGGGSSDANTTFRNYSYTLTGTSNSVTGVDDNEIDAGAFIIGHKYTITTVGNTSFTGIGASGNTVGVVFIATGAGTGTGKAKQTLFYDTTSASTRVVAYVNGIKQVYGSGRDFVATTGTSVAFTYNLGSGDTIDIQVYELLTNAAYYLKSEVYTRALVNSQIATGVSAYLPLAGGAIVAGNGNQLSLDNAGERFTQISFKNSGAQEAAIWYDATDNNLVAHANAGDGFQVQTGGSTPRLTILSGGNVGIGATNPDSPVTIQPVAQGVGTNSVQSWMYALTSGSEFDLKLNQVVSSGLVKYAFTLRNNGTSYANNLVLDRGNVGIGTASPTAKLHIQVADGAEFLKATINANEAWAFKGASGSGSMDYVSFGISGGTQAIAWQEDGNTGIGTTAPGARLSVSGPAALANLGGGSTGSAALYVNTTSGHTGEIIQILKNGSTQLHMANDGKVGIGTSSPLSKLHVHQSGTGSVPVTVANFVTNSNAYGRGPRLDFSVLWGSNLQTAQIAAPNVTGGGGYGGDLSFSTNGQANNTMTERLRLNANGKVEVSGHFKSKDNVSVSHPGSSSGTEYKLTNKAYIGGKVLIPFQVYFPNGVSNLAIRLYTRPTSLWVSGEVTFGSTYSNANAHGFRRYTFTHNFNTTSSYGTGLTNTENVGSNSSHFEFSSHGYDSGEGAHYFEFRHLSSSGNAIYGQLEFHGSAPGYQDNDWYFRCTTY